MSTDAFRGSADGDGDGAGDQPAAREAGDHVALALADERQDLLQPHEPRPQAHRRRQADTITGEPRVAVAERSNTYIEIRRCATGE
jgi:hypothetical protein